MTTFHIDANGKILQATSNPDVIIPGAVSKTGLAPTSGKATWSGSGWDEPLPSDPVDAPLTAEEVVEIQITLPGNRQITRADIDAKKAARGP